MSGPFGSHNFMTKGAAPEGGQSLRFNDDDSAYLSWTPSAAGDRKTWTWSGWVKRGNISSTVYLFGNSNGSNQGFHVRFDGVDTLTFLNYPSSASGQLTTSRLFRDTSAWYHIVLVWDTTNATSGDRMRMYINGERETAFGTASYPSLNLDGTWNSTSYGNHAIGRNNYNGRYFDGYMAEVNFVDGTALDPTSFGETNANGQWVPITSPSVTYGTNGFYLPFTNDYTVEGFNTVTYRGNGADQYVGGVGFEPDFVWIKSRGNSTAWHVLVDSVRGNTKFLYSNVTNAEATSSVPFKSFDTDGFTVGSDTTTARTNVSGETYVAWAWDMGTGSAASNTDGSITSSVKANPTYGQSIVSYTGTNSATETVGHGLSQAPDMVIVKSRDSAVNFWCVYHSGVDVTAPENYLMRLNTTDARLAGSAYFNNTAPTSSVFTIGTSSAINNTDNFIAYCFHSVAGYSDFGSYTGNGSSTGPTVTTGFKPAFLMVKRTDSAGYSWTMHDNTRDPYNPVSINSFANGSNADNTGYDVDFNSDGFQIKTTTTNMNASGGNYIYMAFADKREAAFWLDQSGNNNDWTNNNMQESDISLDSPTNNFATLNPLSIASGETQVLEEGNLNCTNSSSNYGSVATTIGASSGKWYCEGVILSSSAIGSSRTGGGVLRYDDPRSSYIGAAATGWGYGSGGVLYNLGNTVTGVSTLAVGDVFMLAIDIDDGKMWIGKNGTWESSGDPAAGTGAQSTNLTGAGEYFFGAWSYTTTDNTTMNFGQDSSFAGNKVAQGNVDANGFGDFYYEPPAGYLALCTANLPDPAINDGSDHFNTVLYTGNGSTQSITGVGFQPDFTWIKGRSVAYNHQLQDVIRGVNLSLQSDLTAAEGNYGLISSFDADGFSLYTDGTYLAANNSGTTYAAWNWKAGGTGVSNTDGTISSTVSANPTAGFSIVGYNSGASGDKTVGHGLSSAPEMIITKSRDSATYNWSVFHADVITATTKFLRLNTSDAIVTSASNIWGSAFPTSSVFGITSGNGVVASTDCIAYCFHGVEGYSKFGSYTGNGSTDGPFVYTGFRPAWIVIKCTTLSQQWYEYDNQREPYNDDSYYFIKLSTSEAEALASGRQVDFLSNGFKPRGTDNGTNGSGQTYIYMAFAENPFKYSNAR